jgi:ribosome-binding ATPase YchF (GTP1/OBG family)
LEKQQDEAKQSETAMYESITNTSSARQKEAVPVAAECEAKSRSSSFSRDPEFEESLRQFSSRLEQINSGFDVWGGQRLIPNVSEDWLLSIKRKSQVTKSKSPIKSEGLQPVTISIYQLGKQKSNSDGSSNL